MTPVTTDAGWTCIRAQEGAALAAFTPDRKLVMVQEMRPDVAGRHVPTWNIPRGARDPGESHLTTACREFKEETGISANPQLCKLLGWVRADNGLILQKLAIYWAPLGGFERLARKYPEESEEKIIDVQAFNRSQLNELLLSGELQDGYTFSAIGLMFVHGLL